MKKAKIIVLSGQSNAVGVGHTKCLGRSFGEAEIKEYLNGYDKVQIYYHSHSTRSEDFVATTKNCTEANKDTIGPELGMAEYLSQECPDDAYFIVKFAMGGASLMRDFLSPSSGGAYDTAGFEENCNTFLTCEPAKAGWCYTGLVSLLKDSIARLEAKGFACQIVGFCWMQGESDADSLASVNNYKVYFDNFINDLRKEFAQYMDGCVFVDAGISEVWNCYREMNAFKRDYATNHKKFVFLDTIAAGLTTQYEPVEAPDIYHYDSGSIIKLGQLFAKTILGDR